MANQRLITKKEACALAGITARTLDLWFRQEKITKYVNGLGAVRVDEDELIQLITFVPAVASSDPR